MRAWQLNGEKIQVLDGHVADAFVVSARTGLAQERDDAWDQPLFVDAPERARAWTIQSARSRVDSS